MSRLTKCPSCPVLLQRIDTSTSYASKALEACRQAGIVLPAHGPAAIVWLSLVAHHAVCHPEQDLRAYLEAYLNR
jgi:hypothetical protein